MTSSCTPGKLLCIADALSTAPATPAPRSVVEEIEEFVGSIGATLPGSPNRLRVYRKVQEQDSMCQQIKEFVQNGWPSKEHVSTYFSPFWKVKASFSVCEFCTV